MRLWFHFKPCMHWPQCPSTNVDVVVVVVVEVVRCLRWGWSRMEACREASDAVLCTVLSCTLLLLIGVLTAEKESVFLGVGAWLRDKDRELILDCCFLLRSVLEEQRQTGRTVTFGACMWAWDRHVVTARETKTKTIWQAYMWALVCTASLTSSLFSCWCSCCCGSGRRQPGSHFHSDQHWSANGGSAVTSWGNRTQEQFDALSQTLALLLSSWSWDRKEEWSRESKKVRKWERWNKEKEMV